MPYNRTSFAFIALDKYTAPLKRFIGVTRQFSGTVESLKNRLHDSSKSLSHFGTQLANLRTGIVAYSTMRGLKGAVLASIEFEKSLNRVHALSGFNVKDMDILSRSARKYGRETVKTSLEVAGAMGTMAKMGIKNVNDILYMTPAALNLAIASEKDMSYTSEMLYSTLKMFDVPFKDVNKAAGIMAITMTNTALNIEDLGTALQYAGGTAKGVGLDLETVSALLGVLGNKSIKGSKAGRQLMNTFVSLVKVTSKGAAVLRKFGFRPQDVLTTEGHIKDYTRFLAEAEEKGMGVKDIFTLFDKVGGKSATLLLNQSKEVSKLMEKYKDAGTAAEEMAKKMLGKRGYEAFVQMKSSIEDLQISLGQASETGAIGFMKMIKSVSNFISKSGGSSRFLATLLAFAAVSTAIVLYLGIMFALLGVIASLIGSAVASAIFAVIGLVISFLMYWKEIKHTTLLWMAGFGIAASFINPVVGIVMLLLTVVKLISMHWDQLVSKATWLWEKIKNIAKGIGSIFGNYAKSSAGPFIYGPDRSSGLSIGSSSKPSDLVAANKYINESVVKAELTVNDNTGGRVSKSPADRGEIPINVRTSRPYGYGSGGSW